MTLSHSNNDRRRYPRYQLRSGLSVELRVEVSGDKPAILLTRGMVTDLSCGGLKCDINLNVPVGTRVDVRFQETTGAALAPDLMDPPRTELDLRGAKTGRQRLFLWPLPGDPVLDGLRQCLSL